MLSRKTKYGIKALIYLSKRTDQGPISIPTIAKEENIPLKFLEAILLTLKNAGILESKKGKGGGYYLQKEPSDVLMSEVIRLLNGPIAMVPCVSLNFYEKCDDCPDEDMCGVNSLMLEVRDSTLKILNGKTLQQLVGQVSI